MERWLQPLGAALQCPRTRSISITAEDGEAILRVSTAGEPTRVGSSFDDDLWNN